VIGLTETQNAGTTPVIAKARLGACSRPA